VGQVVGTGTQLTAAQEAFLLDLEIEIEIDQAAAAEIAAEEGPYDALFRLLGWR
jgi:hypothetical protein